MNRSKQLRILARGLAVLAAGLGREITAAKVNIFDYGMYLSENDKGLWDIINAQNGKPFPEGRNFKTAKEANKVAKAVVTKLDKPTVPAQGRRGVFSKEIRKLLKEVRG